MGQGCSAPAKALPHNLFSRSGVDPAPFPRPLWTWTFLPTTIALTISICSSDGHNPGSLVDRKVRSLSSVNRTSIPCRRKLVSLPTIRTASKIRGIEGSLRQSK